MSYAYQRTGDFVTLSGVDSPGFCECDAFDAPLGYDERKGYGLAGAWLFFKGEELSKGNVKIRVYPGGLGFEQYRTIFDWIDGPEWTAFHNVYKKPPTGQRPNALQLLHPLTAEIGVVAVVTLNEIIWRQTGNGEWTKEIRFCANRRPKPRLAGPPVDVSTPVPTTPTEQQNHELLEQLARRRAA